MEIQLNWKELTYHVNLIRKALEIYLKVKVFQIPFQKVKIILKKPLMVYTLSNYQEPHSPLQDMIIKRLGCTKFSLQLFKSLSSPLIQIQQVFF